MIAYCPHCAIELVQAFDLFLYRCPSCAWTVTQMEIDDRFGWITTAPGPAKRMRPPSRLHPLVQLDEELRALDTPPV